ncbi:MAG: hypothetical protein OS130_13645 [Thermodesulfobacteriota bacterium]|jgi:hypothetical protein|nr:MAG: hypothetical protein OS130_13645 [Thermodesulfobacteriota bacterium]
MRIEPCVETYFSSKCGLEGEGMSIFRKKEANLSIDSVRFPQRLLAIAAGSLFNCQRAIILEKRKHLLCQAVQLIAHSY